MRKIVRHIVLLMLSFLLLRCANVVSPTGGPKDDTPPVVLSTSPNNNSVNFTGKTIHITFDEYVTLDNPTKNVLISPPMEKSPVFKLNGKTLMVRFEEELKPETTYSINFGNAIKDLHEGNILKNYTYIFSTGNYTDSLSLIGTVYNAYKLEAEKEMYVMLYDTGKENANIDSLPYLSLPDYITMTDDKGKFVFRALSDKNYLLFALKDGNSNMFYDLPNENIAFYPEYVRPVYIPDKLFNIPKDTVTSSETEENLQDSIIDIYVDTTLNYTVNECTLYSYLQEDSIQKLFKKELVEDGLLRFVFRYPAQDVKIEVQETLPDTFDIYPLYSQRQDTVLWYFTPNKDSLLVSINYDTLIHDTIHFSLKPKTVKRRRQETEVKKLSISNNTSQGKLIPEHDLILSFPEPVTKYDMHDTTWFITSKDTVFNNIEFEKIDNDGMKFKMLNTIEPEEKYTIIIPDSVFYSFRGYTNDVTKLSFSIADYNEFGNIYITVMIPDDIPQAIVYLTDENDKIKDTRIVRENGEIAFEFLKPGKYKLKAILDKDGNGIWSPGNYLRKIQPEKVIIYNNVLEIKANWDIDLDEPWILEK